ncbi:MAG: hypothetical protein ACQETH_10615 [Candidatus Rifleibacteriota bacterium]
MSKFIRLLIIVGLLAACPQLYAVTATEIYNDARRAYLNDRFNAAEEVFDNFIDTWPDHKLAESAHYYRTICSAHNLEEKMSDRKIELAEELEKAINSIDNKEADANIALAELTAEYALKGEFDWARMLQLTDRQLLRVLKKEWYPSPAESPLEVLKFSAEKLNDKSLSAELKANVAYVKARALWQLVLSPLPTDLNARIIKMWGDWPVHKSMVETLNTAFALGDSEIKKKIALLGFHFDCFRHKGVKSSCTSGLDWLSYLSERGISRQEVWCPR